MSDPMPVASGSSAYLRHVCFPYAPSVAEIPLMNQPPGLILDVLSFSLGPPEKHGILDGQPVPWVCSPGLLQPLPPLSGQPGRHASVAVA